MNSLSTLNEFKHFSSLLGKNFDLVQGAGGNTSIKLENNKMWVKASGMWLSDADEKNIFCEVDYSIVRENIKRRPKSLVSGAYDDSLSLRPSIETVLHALLQQKVVFHVHSLSAISWLVVEGNDQSIGEILNGISWVRVPYAKPGVDLATLCLDALKKRPNAEVILLDNHGLVVAGESVEAAYSLTLEVHSKLERSSRKFKKPDISLLQEKCANTDFAPSSSLLLHQIALFKDIVQKSCAGTLYPDHVVFLGPGVTALKKSQRLENFVHKSDLTAYSPIVIIEDAGVLVPKNISPAASLMADALSSVLLRVPESASLKYLTPSDVNELMHWEAEKFRQKVN